MPKYRYTLANGRSLVLEGDTMPSDAEVEAAATAAGVRELLMPAEGEASLAAPNQPTTFAPAAVVAADGARRVAERVGLQVATSPNLAKAVNLASRPAAGAIARAVGVAGGLPGYIAGEALTNPSVLRAAETGIRASAEGVARAAGSTAARALTGVPGMIASVVLPTPGDRPVGETAATTAARQDTFAHQFKERVNREAGRAVIEGDTVPEILDSIARHRAGK